jgi:hypothetical protein
MLSVPLVAVLSLNLPWRVGHQEEVEGGLHTAGIAEFAPWRQSGTNTRDSHHELSRQVDRGMEGPAWASKLVVAAFRSLSTAAASSELRQFRGSSICRNR